MIIIIILQVILSIFFIITGLRILLGAMKNEFKHLGYPPVFNQITGFFEISGAILMIIGIWFHIFAVIASILIGGTMLIGGLSHIIKDSIQKALPAIILFILNFIIFIFYI